MDRRQANEEALKRMQDSEPFLVGMGQAKDVIPGMKKNLITHAGPPIEWERMCGPMKGAVIGALIYEGLAKDEEEAKKLAASGEIEFEPNHHHQAVGPMAGVTSASMPVYIIQNRKYGNYAYVNMNEGLGRCLRFGAYSDDVINRLKWMEKVLYPILKEAIELSGGIDMKSIVIQALQMGDDCHNRNKAATAIFTKQIAPYIAKTGASKEEISEVFKFINGNDHFTINITMAMCKSIADAAHNIKGSTIVTAMARNGVEFGIRVSGLGDKWFTAPANTPKGLFFPGFTQEDANPDIGDSTITETVGIGGFAMAGAPAIVQFVGGTPKDAINFTLEMYEITSAENKNFKIPTLDFRGTPTGIDLLKVLETGIVPRINTGMAHKDPGVGQVGAGLVTAPMDCFKKAARYMVENRL
ncbi:DUF1116 domain-containing protein [Biomaibacter acetigenes]|jgi:hypothetical protein|uniref:DUF1116 domain-containing protein n=1 Tax=Biomaibacter acetigenes TaxID=2316383 RepID=A0A3G2R5P7_9FIRM|nr:DUF1116 domain-containing protein [Biomaibacter acetigenes]AYO30187.1 DUF1116 domain-containing protein [Biomaibacter acetigenes]